MFWKVLPSISDISVCLTLNNSLLRMDFTSIFFVSLYVLFHCWMNYFPVQCIWKWNAVKWKLSINRVQSIFRFHINRGRDGMVIVCIKGFNITSLFEIFIMTEQFLIFWHKIWFSYNYNAHMICIYVHINAFMINLKFIISTGWYCNSNLYIQINIHIAFGGWKGIRSCACTNAILNIEYSDLYVRSNPSIWTLIIFSLHSCGR